MPSGYTAAVSDGTITEFREFAMNCARAFGALVTMRDESPDAEIPAEFEPSTSYYDDNIERAKAVLLRVETMTEAECYAEAQKEREQWRTDFEERKRKRAVIRERYEAILASAKDWKPPTDEHIGLKDFMVQQLTESIDFDCRDDYDKPGPFLDARGWRSEQVRKARRDIEYHTAERAKEIDRTNKRNAWIRDLRTSLAPVYTGYQGGNHD